MTSSLYIFHLSFQIFYRTSLLSAFRAYIILIRWIETLEFVSDWVWHKRSSKSSNEWERMWFTYLLPRFTPIKVNTSWLGPTTKGCYFSIMSNRLCDPADYSTPTSLSFTISRSLLKFMSSSHWCHLIISSSIVPFSSYLQSFLASGSFLTSPFFALVAKVRESQL